MEIDQPTIQDLKWTPGGGFDGQRKHGKNDNRKREIVWFSPYCLKVEVPKQIALLELEA